eukprot:PhF_6_TR39448/c0_g1_i1/m.58621/K09935/K09935; uncharacterized protein
MGGPATIEGVEVPCTDNFLNCRFVIDGTTYISAEQYFQASKFEPTNEAVAKLMKETDGESLWAIGRAGQGVRSDWEKVKVDMMLKANREKFSQNPPLAEQLLATGKKAITFPSDEGFWGTWNARILELIREEMAPVRDEEKIQKMLAEFDAYKKQYA